MEYMLVGRSCNLDLEIRLNWLPLSYWMRLDNEPISRDSTRGMDLSDLSLEIVKDRALLLCLQAAW